MPEKARRRPVTSAAANQPDNHDDVSTERGRPKPAIAILLELEEEPCVRLLTETDLDEARIGDWLQSRPDIGALVIDSMRIRRRRRAA